MISKKMSIYIIFIGLPGSGKSTIIKKLAPSFERDDCVVNSVIDFENLGKLQRHLYPFFYLIVDKETRRGFLKVVKLFFKFKKFSRVKTRDYYSSSMVYFKLYLLRRTLININNPDILIWENKYHVLSYIFDLKKIPDETLKEFLCFFPKGVEKVLVVDINIDPKIAFRRYLERRKEKKRWERAFKYSNITHSEKVLQNQEKIIRLAGGLNKVKILSLDGELSPADNAKKIYNYIVEN